MKKYKLRKTDTIKIYGNYAYNLRELGYKISKQYAGSNCYIISWGKE